MADYYPLIARAISGLDPGATGEARRALYERARAALITQLRSVDPPLTETEITRERLALEEAVRRVESEAAQRVRAETRPDAQARVRAGDGLRSSVRPRPAPSAEPDAAGAPRDRIAGRGDQPTVPDDHPDDGQPQLRSLRAEPPRPNAALPVEPRRDSSRPQPLAGGEESRLPPTRERGGTPRRGDAIQPGVRGFRDVVADADDLGGAAAQASRAARRSYASVPAPSSELDHADPGMEDRLDPRVEASYDHDEPEAVDADAFRGRPAAAVRQAPVKPPKAAKAPRALRSPGAPSRFPIKTALLIGVILILAGAAILLGPKAWSSIKGMLQAQPAATVPNTAVTDPTVKPKIADRVGQLNASQIAPVAQRVVLYDEDPTDPQPKKYVGSVVWRTDQIAGTGGRPAEFAVRADIDVPDRKLKMTLSIRRNNDTTLPASHTAELTFALPPDFVGGGVANVPGILMKSSEQTKGTPLAGLAVKVTDGFFLIGLSNVDADKARNVQLLKERSWFDIPLVYTSGRRAILAIEKGPPGERAFNDAFVNWGQ